MAVQRVSPSPDPPQGFSVKDGYLWTMDDPPYSDPETVHHDAEVVHHEAVLETRWFVSGSLSYTMEHGPVTTYGLSDSYPELDVGTSEPDPAAADFSLSGSTTAASRSAGAWSVSFPRYGQTPPAVVEADSVSGSFSVSTEGDGYSYYGTLTVSASSREVEKTPAWDETVPAWDEVVAPPATRKISYLGDW